MTRSQRVPDGTKIDASLYRALNGWQARVVALDAVDPTTVELVRLRCARHHDCRLCLSVRLAVAGQEPIARETTERALEAEVAALDLDLDERHRAVVALSDALMTQPASLTDAVVVALHRHFTADQIVELTLKIMKFNYQKATVALGTDQAVAPDSVSDLSWNTDGGFVSA